MDPTISVSKGCFVFKNGATRAEKSTTRNQGKRKSRTTASVLGANITEQPFFKVYSSRWRQLQSDIEILQAISYSRILEDLVEYVADESTESGSADTYGMNEILPTAALLTGINQPDHLNQFETLSQRLLEKISADVCVLQSRDCSTIKAAVESLVYNFVEAPHEDNEDRDHKRLRRTQCTIKQLKLWYRNNYGERNVADATEMDSDEESFSISSEGRQHALVVILPDFECFNTAVLQDFILILSANCDTLPFVLILGVATSVSAVHNTLPYHVTSKIKLRVFQTQSAPVCLNNILEQVILSPSNVFLLSGKAFKFLTHIFLYYDFSINGFIQAYKYCLMEHYYQGNAYALCTSYSKSLDIISLLTHEDLDKIRRLLSFRPFVEKIRNCKRIIGLLTDDEHLKKELPTLLGNCHLHFIIFRCLLEFLTVLVGDLPKCPLGKLRRELYVACISKELTTQPEFKECWQILSFMSKEEFVIKIELAVKVTEDFIATKVAHLELAKYCIDSMTSKMRDVKNLLHKVSTASMELKSQASNESSHSDLTHLASRHDLKERLLQMSKQDKPMSDYTKAVQETLRYIQNEIVEKHLVSLEKAPPLHELFVFSDIGTVRRNIIGAPRAALHMALNNPHFYLQCKCCTLDEPSQLRATLPDLSVAYKLHLECGRLINLFDWLQAFRSVVDFNEEEQDQVNPQIQARFARAVAELQFLGYIKMSKRKTDHAMRLTW